MCSSIAQLLIWLGITYISKKLRYSVEYSVKIQQKDIYHFKIIKNCSAIILTKWRIRYLFLLKYIIRVKK